MRILKLGLISAFFLFLLWTLLSLLIPSRVRISRATNLAAPAPRVLGIINDTAGWRRWHPWLADSVKAAGDVRFRFADHTDSSSIVYLSHPGVRDLEQAFVIHRVAGADSLTLQWYSDFHLRWYPWEKFSSLFYDGSYGTMMESGLGNLKTLAEGEK